MMISKKIVDEHFQGSQDKILSMFTPEMQELAKGVRFYCNHLQREVVVVALFHGLEGDMPDRCKQSGFKLPASCQGQFCPCCPEKRETIKDGIFAEQLPAVRNADEFLKKLEACQKATSENHRNVLLSQIGLSRISGIFVAYFFSFYKILFVLFYFINFFFFFFQ